MTTKSLRSASCSTFFLKRKSSASIHLFRSDMLLASRASPSSCTLQSSVMSRRLCRASGIRIGSVDGVHDAEATSARDDTSRS